MESFSILASHDSILASLDSILASLDSSAGKFESYPVGNPEDRFSSGEDQMMIVNLT